MHHPIQQEKELNFSHSHQHSHRNRHPNPNRNPHPNPNRNPHHIRTRTRIRIRTRTRIRIRIRFVTCAICTLTSPSTFAIPQYVTKIKQGQTAPATGNRLPLAEKSLSSINVPP